MSAEEALKFLEILRPGGPWTLSAIAPENPHNIVPTETFTDRVKAADWVNSYLGKSNLYYQANPCGMLSRKARETDLTRLDYAFVDVDESLTGERLLTPALKADAIARLLTCKAPGPPSLIVDTGHGIQALWRLYTPLEATPENKSTLIGITKAFIESFKGDKRVWNPTHLLRLPGTVNLPDARKRAKGMVTEEPTRLISAHPSRYDPFEFVVKEVKRIETPEGVVGEARLVEGLDDLAEYDLSETLKNIILLGDDPTDERLEWQGDRSRWLFKCVLDLVRAGVPDQIIKGVILNSDFGISESVIECKGRSPEVYADRQILRAHVVAKGATKEDFEADPWEGVKPEERKPLPLSKFPKYKIWDVCDLKYIAEPEWLIHDLLPDNSFCEIFGPSGHYKTFVMLDMSLHLALGRDYLGRKTKQTDVMYVACEGQTRFKQRIYAWCKEHGVDSDGEELKKHFQCVFNATLIDDLEIASDGTTGGYLSEFMSFMKPGLPKGMFVFDTLNRNMSGDENSTKEMTKFIRGCDYLRNKFETTVMLVHHTGVADPSRGRGASCLPGALDVILNVQRDDASRDIALTVKKNKDGPEGAQWHFERLEVMLNEELMQSSVVLRQKMGDPSLTEEMTIEAQILQDVVTADTNKPVTFNALVALYKGRVGYSRTTIQRALANLRADGLLEAGSPLTFTDKGLAQASEKFNGL